MSELEIPNLATFNVLIEAHMNARATAVTFIASSCAIRGRGRGGVQGGYQKNVNHGPGEQEKERRLSMFSMRDRSFCCNSRDHIASACSYQKGH